MCGGVAVNQKKGNLKTRFSIAIAVIGIIGFGFYPFNPKLSLVLVAFAGLLVTINEALL